MRPQIALDARRMARKKVEGIGHYVRQLASRLPALAPEFEFLLLTDRPLDADKIPDGCRQVVLGRAFGEGSARAKTYSPFWMNCLVPRFLAGRGISLFHGTNYALPTFGRSRYVVTIHDIAFIRVPKTFSLLHRNYLRSLVSMGVQRADHVVVGSEAARSDLVQMVGVESSALSVIHHGIDECYAFCEDHGYLTRVREQLGLPSRYILHVGVVEARKNIETLLRAAAPIIRDGTVDGVVLAGRDGRGADSVRRIASELGVLDNVHFLGYVPQYMMCGLYNLAQVLVFPSLFEGFGLPIIEAMACGTPVVASDSSSLPEVSGGAAFLFPAAEAPALENALRRLLGDPGLHTDLRLRGFARAAAFSWARSAAQHLQVYRRVLGQGCMQKAAPSGTCGLRSDTQ
jgi:glycosyltransferase involved in cell wall biosynthesis